MVASGAGPVNGQHDGRPYESRAMIADLPGRQYRRGGKRLWLNCRPIGRSNSKGRTGRAAGASERLVALDHHPAQQAALLVAEIGAGNMVRWRLQF